ncbi:hypothetical protein LX36DRAFT_710361 [Colletotrichum falcatum]|nr:hypothetical protein LX36DRAFT_710361 [Colletotrichum falcatum]
MPRPGLARNTSPPQTTATPEEPLYSDASSSYWPPGWNYDHYHRATHADIAELPEHELLKMQSGLRDVLGEDAFVEQVGKIVEIPFQRAVEGGGTPPESPKAIEEAKSKFEITWIQDAALADGSAQDLRARFGGLGPDLPAGISEKAFLVASAEAVASVLDLEEADRPTANFEWRRPSAPFLLVVAADSDPGLEEGHEEREWFKPVFKVAAEAMVEELWWTLDSDMTPLRRITRGVKGLADVIGDDAVGEELDDVWWTMVPSPGRTRKRHGF